MVRRICGVASPAGQQWLRHCRRDLSGLSFDDAEARTREAMVRGMDVIYQAARAGDGWRGYADVLVRVERASALGAWSYEAHDTKLARETRGGTILQLSAYSELLAGMQGVAPEAFHLVTPAGERAASLGTGSGAASGALAVTPFVVASPALLEAECRTPRQMALANALCRFVELAGPPTA